MAATGNKAMAPKKQPSNLPASTGSIPRRIGSASNTGHSGENGSDSAALTFAAAKHCAIHK
ncbi:hypothetical protein LBMAG49_22590 [Planctomycetota bacterium]|nr:hypothetical protein LBMAG49_22590 [Planctomycetota bacterium]